jgi:hypothetical protein
MECLATLARAVMGGQGVYQRFPGVLEQAYARIPDLREGENCCYSIGDTARAASGVSFCQSPSFFAHQQLMQPRQGRNNGQTLFGIK